MPRPVTDSEPEWSTKLDQNVLFHGGNFRLNASSTDSSNVASVSNEQLFAHLREKARSITDVAERNDIVTRLAATPYERVAEAFGAHGERVEKLAAVGPAVRRALDSGRPALINLLVSNDVVHPVTTMLLGDVTATDQIVVPYYQNLTRT